MKKEYLKRLTELVAALAATFGKEADEAMYLGYEMALSDLSLEDIERGFQAALRTCEFMPSGADLRKLAGHVGTKERAAIALGVVEQAIRSEGYYRSVTFDDPLVNAVIRSLGGWEHACTIEGEFEIGQWRREFEKLYQAMCKTGASAAACAPLLGHSDRVNGFNGHERKEPLRIETGLAPHPAGLIGQKKEQGKLPVQLKLKGPK